MEDSKEEIIITQNLGDFDYTFKIQNEQIIDFTRCRTWDSYLLALKKLPEKLLNQHKFIPGTKDEKDAYAKITKLYNTLSEWLDYLVPGVKSLNPELFFTNKIVLKPRAQLSKRILNLSTELLPRYSILQEEFETPADIWYEWEKQSLDFFLWNSGLLTGKPILQPSKDEMEDANRKIASKLENQTSNFSNLSKQSIGISTVIDLLAEITAKENFNFRYSEVFKEYIKARRKWATNIRSSAFETIYLENGNYLPKGRKAPRKRM